MYFLCALAKTSVVRGSHETAVNKDSSVLKLPASRLRRIALAQQGLLNSKSLAQGKSGVAKVVSHLGYVQIDTISVVERAHHHVLWTRIKNYRPEFLDIAVEKKEIFEYWFHAAAYLPMQDYRFALPRMNAIRAGEKHWFNNVDKKLMRSVYKRIETEGPLRARDFEDSKSTNTGWWDWKPAKQAIEKLFMQGDLMIVGREGFQKRYDLTERVLPVGVGTKLPDHTEEARHLVDTTLRAHGFANLKSITYLRKGKALRDAVKECVESYVESGRAVKIQSPTGEMFYCNGKLLNEKKRPGATVRLLSPFDNLVIQRQRCREIFAFDYQIECYVPAAKRVHGYFCLPILYKDKLVGRLDCKADRKIRELQINYLQHDALDDAFLSALADELKRFMCFNNCEKIVVKRGQRSSNAQGLQRYLSMIP